MKNHGVLFFLPQLYRTKSETFLEQTRVRSKVSLDSQIPAGLGGQRCVTLADVASDHNPRGGKVVCFKIMNIDIMCVYNIYIHTVMYNICINVCIYYYIYIYMYIHYVII